MNDNTKLRIVLAVGIVALVVAILTGFARPSRFHIPETASAGAFVSSLVSPA